MPLEKLQLEWLGHSGFKFIWGGKVMYLDPYMISDYSKPADFIFLTHSHYDHCSLADLQKIVTEKTVILLPADAQSKINRFSFPVDMRIVEPMQEFEIAGIKISCLPSYNLHTSFHTKSEGWVGYVLCFDEITLYHAGDTDLIPEMQKLTGFGNDKSYFIALLPVGGKYVMDADEAAEAAALIKPNLAIPMHYGSIHGTLEDAQEFVKLCEEKGIKAMILEKS